MKLGIIGLPNVGKSTLFNAITKAGVGAENYPFCTIEPNVGVVAVPDKRIDKLSEMFSSKKKIFATIEFYDIAGLVRGASKGEGLGNKFLGHIREVSAIAHVVRCFDDENVVHVEGKPNPKNDIETINLELIFSDLEVIERRLEKTKKMLKGDKALARELDYLERLKTGLEKGKNAREVDKDDEMEKFTNSLNLLSAKPIIYVANVSEGELAGEDNDYVAQVKEQAVAEGAEVVVVSAKVESELVELDEADRLEFLSELGVSESGLDKLIHASYSLLDLISFLTAGEPETRGWTIRRGTKAPGAAGKIHTDFERGFIRAETIAYQTLVECGSLVVAKERGQLRSEGKEYVVKDGDVMHFLFNV